MNTIILAQCLGIFVTVVGLSLIVSQKGERALLIAMTENSAVLWLIGLIALGFGAVIVSLNNVWSGTGIQLLITIIGWLAVIKGFFILVFPSTASPFYRKANNGALLATVGVIVFLLGLILLYGGFM